MRVEPPRALSAPAIALALLLWPPPPAAAAAPDVQSLFPHRAAIFVDHPGVSRLPLPAEIVTACRPDLADLRIVDLAGREVPYLVTAGPPPDTVLEERLLFAPRLLFAAQRTEERESAPDLRREIYHLSLPAGDPRPWDLVVDSRRAGFVRQVDVTAVRPGGQEIAVWRGSLFRLSDGDRERLEVGLPPLDAGYLVVTLEGEDEEGYLEPSFRLVGSRRLPEHERLRVGLEVVDSRSRNGRTMVDLDRPRGLVPDRLDVATTTGSFNRRFVVRDEGPGLAAAALGSVTLYRLEGVAGAERTEIPLAAARGDRLRVIIDDGDSPPLEDLAFHAVLRRPVLVFSLAAGGSRAAAGHMLYGGARAFRPRYDLAGLLSAAPGRVTGEEARIGVELLDPGRLGLARLGPPAANPRWDPSPALAFAMRPGTEIATWSYRYRRAVPVPGTREGLLRLALDAPTLARCRRDLADLRLVDAESRQWPYLLDRSGATQRVVLEASPARTVDGTSTYALALPEGRLSVLELVLDTPAAFFDREYELVAALADRAGREVRVASGRLTRRPEDPAEIVLTLGGARPTSLELRVRDGDDTALEWTSVEIVVPRPELYFAAPEGEYTLLFGDPEARRPRYELERVRDLVLAVDSTPVEAGELVQGARRGALARFRGDGGWQQVLLWSAILLATLVLAWLTLRLARQEPGGGG